MPLAGFVPASSFSEVEDKHLAPLDGTAPDDRRRLDLAIERNAYGITAMRPVYRRGPERASRNPAPPCITAPCCGLPSSASELPTPSAVRSSHSVPRLGGAGTKQRSGSLETWCASEQRARCSAQQPPPPGREGGGRPAL